MTTYFAPQDLKFTQLGDVEPGSIVQIIGREANIPYAIRLASEDRAEKIAVLVLGGEYAYTLSLLDRTKATQVVIKASETRYALESPSAAGDPTHKGNLTVLEAGAFITSRANEGAFEGTRIDLATWRAFDARISLDVSRVYTSWKLGALNPRGDFDPIYFHGTTP